MCHAFPSSEGISTATAKTSVRQQPKASLSGSRPRQSLPFSSYRAATLNKSCLLTAFGSAPIGSRLLRVNFEGGVVVFPKRPKPDNSLEGQMLPMKGEKVASVTCGVYRTPLQFARCSVTLGHPFDACSALPDQALRVLATILIEGPVSVKRLNVLVKWKAWEKELAAAESKLHASLHPAVASVLKGKRLLLLDRVANPWSGLMHAFTMTWPAVSGSLVRSNQRDFLVGPQASQVHCCRAR